MAQQWFYKVMGQQFGPISSMELRNLAQHGTILLDTQVTNSPNGPWVLAENVKGLFPVFKEKNQHVKESQDESDPLGFLNSRPASSTVSPKENASLIQQSRQMYGPNYYTLSNLMSGEKILYAATIHPLIFLPSCIPLLLIIIGFGMIGMGRSEISMIGVGLILVGLIMFPLFAIKALIIFLTTECVLTDKRVIGKVGFLSRTSLEILLNKVEGLQVNQGLFGRIFDYGTIVVSGTGGSKTPFQGIAKPLDFRKHVQQQIDVV